MSRFAHLESLLGTEGMYCFMPTMLDELKQRHTLLQEAIEQQDNEKALLLLHKLAGTVHFYGSPTLIELLENYKALDTHQYPTVLIEVQAAVEELELVLSQQKTPT